MITDLCNTFETEVTLVFPLLMESTTNFIEHFTKNQSLSQLVVAISTLCDLILVSEFHITCYAEHIFSLLSELSIAITANAVTTDVSLLISLGYITMICQTNFLEVFTRYNRWSENSDFANLLGIAACLLFNPATRSF